MAHKTLSLYSWNVFNFVCEYKVVACFQDHEAETVLILYFGQYSMLLPVTVFVLQFAGSLGTHVFCFVSSSIAYWHNLLHIRFMFSSIVHS